MLQSWGCKESDTIATEFSKEIEKLWKKNCQAKKLHLWNNEENVLGLKRVQPFSASLECKDGDQDAYQMGKKFIIICRER